MSTHSNVQNFSQFQSNPLQLQNQSKFSKTFCHMYLKKELLKFVTNNLAIFQISLYVTPLTKLF